MKIIIALLLSALLAFAWMTFAGNYIGTTAQYNSYINNAQKSYSESLYEQAAEYYNKALITDASDLSLHILIKDAYKAYYDEQLTASAKNKYINSLINCCEIFNTDSSLYEELIRIYYDNEDYNQAYSYALKARKNGAVNDYIAEVGMAMQYMYNISTTTFTGYQHTLCGKYVVNDEGSYYVSDTDGRALTPGYPFIGAIDANSMAVYKDVAGFALRDSSQIIRLKLYYDIEACGCYADGLLPIKTNGEYIFVNEQGTDSGIGKFEFASIMSGRRAAIMQNGKWRLISADGDFAADAEYDDIALDMYGRHTAGAFYAAKNSDLYAIYNAEGVRIGDFSCADIDISTDSELFAYKDVKSGLWGFADATGAVIIEPQYYEAKAFSNGFAAVKNADGLWGFINEEQKLVIDYNFADASYFTSDKRCIVSTTKDRYGILEFRFQ